MVSRNSSCNTKEKRTSKLKRLFKLFGSAETKKDVKNKDVDGHYEFDAIPDHSDVKEAIDSGVNIKINQIKKEKSKPTTTAATNAENEDVEENASPSGQKLKENCSSQNPPKSGFQTTPGFLGPTNITLNGGGTVFQFGKVDSKVWNVYYQQNVQASELQNQNKQTHKSEKTEAVKELLECKVKVEAAHLNFLADHLGAGWKEVGQVLKLTTGELQGVEARYDTLEERSYQMLIKWWQSTGESCTVGRLCKTLWRSNIGAAQEAVKQLSLNIQDFN